MYVGDTMVTFSSENTASLEFQINKELASLENWLIANKLSLNISKTEFMPVTTRQKRAFIDDKLSININSKPISQFKCAKTLGLHTEGTLSWSKHIEHI